MPRPSSLLPALAAATLGVLLGLLVSPVPTATAAAPVRAHAPKRVEAQPLAVTIDRLTPSAIPRSGPVRVSGQVTNLDDQAWVTINLYPFVSADPMTSGAELAAAAATDPADPVGERITDPGPYFVIETLAPGESKQYSFSIPRKEIAATSVGVAQRLPGVYWFGVHALGQTDAERDTIADGRARTFLPFVPASTSPVDTALVVPVRQTVRYDADGRVADVARWTRALATGGRLRALTDFGTAAGDRLLSWLVDPAVVDAAVQLSQGNPARSLEPTIDEDPEDPEDPEDSESPSPSESPSDEADAEPDARDEEVAAASSAATEWLGRLETGLADSEVLGLPYGDVDVSAAATHQPETYAAARERTGTELAPWGLSMSPAIGSPDGFLSPEGLSLADPATQVLVTDRMFDEPPGVARTDGRTLVVTSSAATTGGPGPDRRRSSLAMRQRLVSEAAVRAIAPGSQPLVVLFPSTWAPDSTVGFFEGLDLPWLNLTTVSAISQRAGRTVPAEDLRYSERQRQDEVAAVDFAGAHDLTTAGDTLQNLLTLNDEVGGVVRDEAFSLVGYAARRQPVRTRASAIRSEEWIEEQLQSVQVEGPRAVILSSGSGRFSAALTNDLDQPVTVRLRAVTDAQLRVSVPEEPIELAPDRRTTVLLNVSSDAVGVRSATLLLTDTEGTPLGSSDSLPIRSNRVSNVIWLILGTGVGLLLATIVLRLVRRVRASHP